MEKSIIYLGVKMKKAALHNLGCKVNAYETEAMQQMLEAAGGGCICCKYMLCNEYGRPEITSDAS